MRTRTILVVACLAITTFNDFGGSVEVSSKIELDSDERAEEISSNLAVLDETDPSESTSPSDSFARTRLKQQQRSYGRRYDGSELVKARESRKRRIDTLREDSSSPQPKVINNIQIVVNGNDSTSNTNSCKHGVCDVSVSSKPDGKGNIVTQVRLTVITSAKPGIQMDDVPVVNGFRGINRDQNERPILRPIMTPSPVYSYLRRDGIPQIQSNYQDYGEPWYQHRRTFQRPRMYYHHFEDRNNVEFRGRKTWPRDGPMIDDKIEPPLGGTTSSATM